MTSRLPLRPSGRYANAQHAVEHYQTLAAVGSPGCEPAPSPSGSTAYMHEQQLEAAYLGRLFQEVYDRVAHLHWRAWRRIAVHEQTTREAARGLARYVRRYLREVCRQVPGSTTVREAYVDLGRSSVLMTVGRLGDGDGRTLWGRPVGEVIDLVSINHETARQWSKAVDGKIESRLAARQRLEREVGRVG